uniref:aralkylamine N-acetyltransferase n=1 Tax=Steinernema glaseri TaxID=37863 RepID=A0A1I8AMH6_9BILA
MCDCVTMTVNVGVISLWDSETVRFSRGGGLIDQIMSLELVQFFEDKLTAQTKTILGFGGCKTKPLTHVPLFWAMTRTIHILLEHEVAWDLLSELQPHREGLPLGQSAREVCQDRADIYIQREPTQLLIRNQCPSRPSSTLALNFRNLEAKDKQSPFLGHLHRVAPQHITPSQPSPQSLSPWRSARSRDSRARGHGMTSNGVGENSENLRVVKVCEDDSEQIYEFLCKDFLHSEPLNASVELTKEEAEDFHRDIVKECLQFPLSYAMKNEKDEIVAVRLSNILRRRREGDHHVDFPPHYKSWKSNEIFKLITEVEGKIWDLVPYECHRVMSVSIISVDAGYGRRGIAKTLLEHNLHEVKSIGCQGVITELSAIKSQKLFLEKLGYTKLYEVLHTDWRNSEGKQIFKCKDDTDRCVLAFKSL